MNLNKIVKKNLEEEFLKVKEFLMIYKRKFKWLNILHKILSIKLNKEKLKFQKLKKLLKNKKV